MSEAPPQYAAVSPKIGPPPVADRIVRLQIGEQRFITFRQTLTQGSGYFARLFSGRWMPVLVDNHYFVDANPSLFEHILRYLRTGILPLCYDNLKGHDHAFYVALAQESRFFDVPDMITWLEKQEYLKAVSVKYEAKKLDDISRIASLRISSDTEVQWFPSSEKTSVYVCPREIMAHRGDRSACGIACLKAKGASNDQYEDEYDTKVLVVQKRTIISTSPYSAKS